MDKVVSYWPEADSLIRIAIIGRPDASIRRSPRETMFMCALAWRERPFFRRQSQNCLGSTDAQFDYTAKPAYWICDMPMTLSAFAYVSRATNKLSCEKLNEIVNDAKDFNGRHELSGALVYDGSCFFQYIEGPRLHLADAYARIRASRSHIILLSLIDGPVPTRRFEGWEMYYRDGVPSGIDALNWLPGQEPSGDPKRDLVANALSYFWRTFDNELAPAGHS